MSAAPLWLYETHDGGVAAILTGIEAVDHRDGVGRRRGVVLEDLPHLARGRHGVGANAAMEIRPERVQIELEGRHDPEVPAGAAHAPEQLRLLRLAGADETPVGSDELDRADVVDREPEMALEPPHATAEGQARDPCVTDDTDGTDEAVLLGSHVELAEERPAVDPRGPASGIDGHATHAGHVDDEPTISCRMARRAVAARPDRELQVVLAGEANRRCHLPMGPRPNEDRRSPIVHGVPQPAGFVVLAVRRRDDLALEDVRELPQLAPAQCGRRVRHRVRPPFDLRIVGDGPSGRLWS